MAFRKFTDYIIVHCAATPPSLDIGAETIRKWHTDPKPQGRGWSDIGYHFVIKRDGTIENGRDIAVSGAHVRGKNNVSVGICMVGGVSEKKRAQNNFTDEQFESLKKLLKALKLVYPNAEIAGHNEFARKACPSFNVKEWLGTVEI